MFIITPSFNHLLKKVSQYKPYQATTINHIDFLAYYE